MHSTVLGPAMGGTRMKQYPAVDDAVRDVLRLSQAMTMKQAAAGLPYGGGKAVLAVPAVPARGSTERAAVLDAYASLIDALHGTYVTAADMNTGPDDMDEIATRTPHVLGRSAAAGGSGDPGEEPRSASTTQSVPTCRHAFGTEDLEGRTMLVQGAGSVGGPPDPRAARRGRVGARRRRRPRARRGDGSGAGRLRRALTTSAMCSRRARPARC